MVLCRFNTPARCLLASTNEGDLVLDPFLGNGTTAVASLRLKRGCVGIELDLHHVEIAARRADREIIEIRLRHFRIRVEISVVASGLWPDSVCRRPDSAQSADTTQPRCLTVNPSTCLRAKWYCSRTSAGGKTAPSLTTGILALPGIRFRAKLQPTQPARRAVAASGGRLMTADSENMNDGIRSRSRTSQVARA